MATITKYKLNGVEYEPPREWRGVEVLATFDGDSVQANITTSEFSFVNDSKDAIDNWFSTFPTEGMPLQISISNETTTYTPFKGYLDFRTMQYLSDIELICGIKQDNGLASLDTRLRGITMELLYQKGVFAPSDYANIPYIVENRKTQLEKVFMLFQVVNLSKTMYDEIHKIINIASDITSAGVVQAVVNLTVTMTNLVLLISQLIDLFQQIQESFFPPIRYHKGISLYTAIEKAVGYCGYSLDAGVFGTILQKTKLCPSKDDEIGTTMITSTGVGILKPRDFGWVTSDLFALSNMLFYTKVAIVGNTLVIRPYNDPYWIQSSTFVMPNVKIEQAFVKNGMRSINYNELVSSRILQYTTDSSDLWTLTTVADQISVTTVTPINVNEEKRVLLTGSEQINIPYSMCVRKDAFDDLFTYFTGITNGLDQVKDTIEAYFNSVASILTTAFPVLENFTGVLPKRSGCMKVENHFFSQAKIVYLESSDNRIPANYADIIGAVALQNNYHSYKSFVGGVRNPLDLSDTNAKDVYSEVTIPMGIDDFNTLITNSYFTTVNGNLGKFTRIAWLPDQDQAVCDFYIQSNWAVNIEETTV